MTGLEERVAAEVESGAWSDALVLLDDAGLASMTPELLELKARAAYGAGEFEDSVASWEELHALHVADGDESAAARAAAMVAMFLMMDTGLMSPVRGWLRRSEALLGGTDGGSVRAVIAAVRAYERFMCGDLAAARKQSDLAVELGDRHGNLAARVIGLTAGSRITVLEGDVLEGVAQLEDVGTILMSGDVDPLTTGMMLCELVCAAQGLARHDMAVEWTEAMDRWQPGAAVGGLHGRCRVHKAEILRVSGPCEAAEAEALGACDDLRPWMRREFGWPLAELGTIRLRKGDLDGAAEAFLAAHEHVWSPHPGLALVRLSQGQVGEAMALIDAAIASPLHVPSKERPPFSELTMAPLMEARAEIAVAAGDPVVATAAAQELQAISERFPGPWLSASASLATARAALLRGELEVAAASARAATDAWLALGSPYETAAARLVLAEALEGCGNPTSARLEREAARAMFESYGAVAAAQQVERLLEDRSEQVEPESDTTVVPPSADPSAASGAATATFRLDGDTREVVFSGNSALVRDLKGYRYLARLLAQPDREFHVLDLVSVEQGTLPTGSPETIGAVDLGTDEVSFQRTGEGLPVLDDQAREAYRRRLAEVEEDMADALACHDPVRAELCERDREYLVSELARAVGLGGRLRTVGSDAERARTAVTRVLRYAIGRLGEHNPALSAHLDNAVRTGTYCSYRPDRAAVTAWDL